MSRRTIAPIAIACMALLGTWSRADDAAAPKPKVAVFPLAGDADQDKRDAVGFSLRTKLDKDGHYEPIDGPTMADYAAAAAKPVDLTTDVKTLTDLVKDDAPVILIWGKLDAKGPTLTVNVVDLRTADKTVHTISKPIAKPTDMRFVVEDVLKTVPGVGPFGHPVENEVTDDQASRDAWAKNPNLVPDGDFATSEPWRALLEAQDYHPPISESLPGVDKVVIYQKKKDAKTAAVSEVHAYDGGDSILAFNLSKETAENNGQACLSSPFDIKPNTRYRLQFRYKSAGPNLHVFVKGYVKGKDIAGKDAEVQCYECQVPPSGGTKGQWKTVVCDINPQSPNGPPAFLKVDLYAYLSPGRVEFSDIEVKEVGAPTRKAVDEALKPEAKH
jgi:hypothetical protein